MKTLGMDQPSKPEKLNNVLTDYLILKMMAAANNPERGIKDEADIAAFINLQQKRGGARRL